MADPAGAERRQESGVVSTARFDALLALVRDVVAIQGELVAALEELQNEVLEHATTRSAVAEDIPNGGGLRGQAHQSQLQSRRLIQRASELSARAEQLCAEAAGLTRHRPATQDDAAPELASLDQSSPAG